MKDNVKFSYNNIHDPALLNRPETQFSSRLNVFPDKYDVTRLRGYYFAIFGLTFYCVMISSEMNSLKPITVGGGFGKWHTDVGSL
jgi:hypothetical protein